jgi:hypothetical protein
MSLLPAGAAGRGRTAAAGTGRLGGRSIFIPHFGGTTAHQLVDALLAAIRALDFLVGLEDQAFKCLIALLTMKLKNWHFHSLMGNCRLYFRLSMKTKIKSGSGWRSGSLLVHSADPYIYNIILFSPKALPPPDFYCY